ncbi:MAG TPA: glycerate kinase [Opitutus sp.]|nr:glycerate kinase [Opitutus sp.]
MRALLAFDKFKDALSAPAACDVAADTLRALHATWELDRCPLTDGGEGFAEILTHAAGGHLRSVRVQGPRGEVVDATFGVVALAKLPPAARTLLALPPQLPSDATLAIVEMAAASGLALLRKSQRDPWHTTTFGTGELLRAAADAGAAAILLGVGGSATNDLGLGALAALGVEFQTAAGETVSPPTPARWPEIARIQKSTSPPLPPIRIACDVTNPLLGDTGCAAVYGPQKGLRHTDRARLEQESARLAGLLCAHCGQADALMDVPGAGAAGGISFGLMTAANAMLLPGFALVSAWLGLDTRIAAADLVLTGEGRFDRSSLTGKGPGAIAARAAALRREVHVFAGTITDSPPPDVRCHAITPDGLPLETALAATRDLLGAAIRRQFAQPAHAP